MIVFSHQNVGQSHSLLTANAFFENMAKFKYFGTTVKKIGLTKRLKAH